MSIGVYYVESTNADSVNINIYNREVVKRLSRLSGEAMEFTDLEHVNDYDLLLSFIAGGGVEGRFKAVLDQLPQPVFMLTTGLNNSLAASMEILSYLKQNDIPGEIIHGSEEKMAKRIAILAKVFKTKKRISSMRIARVGEPSDWLISSDVDAERCKELTGIEIIDVTMKEFFDEIAKKEYVPNMYTEMIKARNWHPEDTELCCQIYGALRRIVDKYNLDGVTVRCFDLLGPIRGTGCLALAILNAEGIYAGCEGDTPSLISMCVIGELSGQPVFMANPSRILSDDNDIIFAHCTLPINMPTSFELMTHFESGLGVAFRGHIQEGPVTLFKSSGLMEQYFVTAGELKENLKETNLCRTQVKIHLDEETLDYFLTESIGNHHMIVNGDWVDLVDEFYKWF
ncbi:MAG: hypothetical protein IJG49_01810 [Erysipelotrichaceae bacterium]|nr:hypothetical protein [Erysipelotrichaceae bacterium]